jgi:hypothetical protein
MTTLHDFQEKRNYGASANATNGAGVYHRGNTPPADDFDYDRLADEATVKPTFAPQTLAQLFNRPPKPWLIDKLIGAGDLAVLYGPPGSGKTFITVDLIFTACLGQTFARRFDVARPLSVAYCAGEGISGLADRFRAAAHYYNTGPNLPRFYFFDLVPQLFNTTGADAVERFADEWQGLQAAGQVEGLDLLVIDTLHSATAGLDENSAQHMGQVLAALKVAQKRLGCAVLLIHHSNKAGTGERGSSALRGAADCMIETSEAAGKFSLTCAKLKDAEAWKPQTFDLIAVGDCESARVWWDEPVDEETGDKRENRERRRAILQLLDDAGGLTVKEIAQQIGHTEKATGNMLGRMVDSAGLLTRAKRGGDKGPLVFGLTELGKAALQELDRS